MNLPKSLQSGTRIDDYEIRETLWTTNAGFIYRAADADRERDVMIQEFLPASLAARHWSGIHAMPLDGLDDEFDQGLTRFLREARILAQIHDPYVCRVYEYTEANATAYMVLDYEPGQTLKDHLASRQTPLDESEIRKLLMPLLKGLRVAHAAGLLHRDIHPANIYLRDVGPPVLIGFGSPVTPPRGEGDQFIEHRLAPGYSPAEQYQSDGELGPWSDLYALGATMYRCLSGAAPVDAAHRVMDIAQNREDPLVPATELGVGDYSSGLLGAIDWMMEPMAADRPETAGAVLGPLTEERSARRDAPAPAKEPAAPPATSTAPAARAGKDQGKGREQGKSGMPLHRAPLRAEGPPTSTPPAAGRRRKSPKNRTMHWGLPALLVLTGLALVAFFVLREPPGTQRAGVSGVTASVDSQPAADRDVLDDPPPELPEKVNFGRQEDDARAARYRDLERQTEQISELLVQAQEHMNAGRLVSPAGNNALESYRAVLAVDPGHTDAQLGIRAIQAGLLDAAETAFSEEKDIESATSLLDQVAEIGDTNQRAESLRAEIKQYLADKAEQERLAREAEQRREEERRQAEQQRQEELRTLVARADAALEAGQLTQPPGDNALAYYRRALELEPDHAGATQGIERIGRHYLDRASEAIARDELERAEGLLSTAAAVLPNNDSVPLLEKQLETRRAVAEQERRRQAELERQRTQARAQQETAAATSPAAPEDGLEDGIAAYYAGDYDIAFRLLEPLSEAGQARAKFRVAMMYYHGRGVAQDINLAETLIREALPRIREEVEAGAAWAQADLGSLYADGIVVAENDKEAVRLYRLAAEQGYAGAQTNLGVMYANGEGVYRNREDAIAWLRRAAEQGDRIAQKNLQALGIQ
ncbi:MAG TPA: protein kinase [Arenicellales bacterium]|nr:protein kinase [Arenicellales bacterium]